MFKALFFFLATVILPSMAYSQTAGDFTAGVNVDLIKTDHVSFLEKTQIGLEGNYFVLDKLTATAGFDIWTGDRVSFVIGGRWYPAEEAFVRFRGLLGENDLSIGGGWTQPLHSNWKLEAIGDFYFSIDFAIRAGIVYTFNR